MKEILNKLMFKVRKRNYGKAWEFKSKTDDDFIKIYGLMHASNEISHIFFKKYIKSFFKDIETVCEVGGGVGIYYPEWFFENFKNLLKYRIIDSSSRAIRLSKVLVSDKRFDSEVGIIEEFDIREQFDLVFSLRSIDNSFSIENFILACIKASKKLVYITFTNDFTQAAEHQYVWNAQKYFYWNVSKPALEKFLDALNEITSYEIRILQNLNNKSGEMHLIINRD